MAYYGKWYIGSTAGGYSRGVEAKSVEMCAENIDNADWIEWTGSEWTGSVENISIKCADENDQIVTDDNNLIEDDVSKRSQIYNLLAADNDRSDDFQMQENSRTQTDFKSNGEDSSLEDTPENDPRDMFFILRDWNQIWQVTQTGFPIYSSNYPGGIFCTDEGYEFELEIYPKECGRKILLGCFEAFEGSVTEPPLVICK